MDETRPLDFASIKPILAATALACALACAGSAGFAQTGAIMIAIDKMTVGAAPADFEFARTGQGGPAQWAVAADAIGRGRARHRADQHRHDRLPLSARDLPDRCRPAMWMSPFGSRRLPARSIRPAASPSGSAIADNYYVVRANALEDNVRFYRVVKGRARADRRRERQGHGRTNGICSGFARKASGSRSRLTAGNCSPRPTAPSRARARSRSGPRPTALRASMASRSRHCHDRFRPLIAFEVS